MSHEYYIITIIVIMIPIFIYSHFYQNRQKKQLVYIKNYIFPDRIKLKLKEQYQHLTNEEIDKVLFALRDYFSIANKANGKTVAMPSKVVDTAWHEFIIFTKVYKTFSQKAFGRFFHHIPTESIEAKESVDDTLKLTWKLACLHENIMPTDPDKLPLLFAIDELLKIEDGNIYSLDDDLTNMLTSQKSDCFGVSGGGGCSGFTGCGGS
ncbi:glycine-rich domain-containing protein [Sulfurovum mangrovi]|uniref:glycine-rich domain-containing protein n=1 Tax=Sulfurovum mangrovi TaxID=2893889 RepID=UPI001E3377BB|nr:hypothetical protein [Sulfurovum mangrovi]UFH59043.1 hypothetical protein LN246_11935 [Sulfurovum mangrovi]